jgi:HEPN domain-containing protein
MSVPPEVTEVLRRWVRKAEHDLEAARLILAGGSNCPYDTACFHCHQAAEKYLKALLTLLGPLNWLRESARKRDAFFRPKC